VSESSNSARLVMNELRLNPVSNVNPYPEERRSARVILKAPLTVKWTIGRREFAEFAETEMISAHGSVLVMSILPPAAAKIHLHNDASDQDSWARVVGFCGVAPGKGHKVAVELSAPSYEFWGISFPPSSDSSKP